MCSQTKPVRQPQTDDGLRSGSAGTKALGEEATGNVIEKISIDRMSIEERRREAKKPLYLVRYE